MSETTTKIYEGPVVLVSPACPSCGVEYIKHLGLHGTCQQLQEAADEIERLRDLCESAKHWLTLPPTTGSDRYCVEELCRKLKAAGQGRKP